MAHGQVILAEGVGIPPCATTLPVEFHFLIRFVGFRKNDPFLGNTDQATVRVSSRVGHLTGEEAATIHRDQDLRVRGSQQAWIPADEMSGCKKAIIDRLFADLQFPVIRIVT